MYGPYGNRRYTTGSMGTNMGYTGQNNDPLTGLDYYNARYYDPVVGVFLSADNVQGNTQGMDPYAYVAGNPETMSDPTGQSDENPEFGFGAGTATASTGSTTVPNAYYNAFANQPINSLDPNADVTLGNATYTYDPLNGAVTKITPTSGVVLSPGDSGYAGLFADYEDAVSANDNTNMPVVNSHILNQYRPQTQTGGSGGGIGSGGPPVTSPGGECSFTPDTQVTTDQGKEAIGNLQVGDKVMAYNPKTHKMEAEPILHVWKHSDNDLIDLTLTSETPAHNGKPASKTSEVLHTTSEHPFLTTEQGFTPAGQLKIGMHVLRADGSVGVVTDWKSVPGTKVMYNLEVQQDHTFTVGVGEWVVHNKCDSGPLRKNLGLPPNGSTLSQQAQHIVPCQTSGLGSLANPMVSLAETGNLNFLNGAWNGIGLPDNWGDAARLGLPRHLGSHSNYTGQILELLDIEWGRVQAASPGGVNVADAQDGVMRVADWARAKIIGAGGGCTINQVNLDVGYY